MDIGVVIKKIQKRSWYGAAVAGGWKICPILFLFTDIENAMEEVETRLYNIRQDKISEDNVYQFLLFFDKLYDKFTDLEKKTFLKSFLSDVFIYEEEQKDGRILKGLRFKFPIYMNGRNVLGVDWDNESTDETVVGLHRKDMQKSLNLRTLQSFSVSTKLVKITGKKSL